MTMRPEVAEQTGTKVKLKCSFCKGTGKDPFGIMSKLSTCQVCMGQGVVYLPGPVLTCKRCRGTGVEPNTRLTCMKCRGYGSISAGDADDGVGDIDSEDGAARTPRTKSRARKAKKQRKARARK